jgi:hypothetical protein
MEQIKINEFCREKKYVKKPECTLPSLGGKYKSMTLREFITYRSSDQSIKQPTFETIDSIQCLVLYRVDYNIPPDYNILYHLPNYDNRIKLYKENKDGIYPEDKNIHSYLHHRQIISFSRPSTEIKNLTPDIEWGNEPSIGINTSFDLNVLYYYSLERIEKRRCILYKFYFPISDNIYVCVIPRECQWTHITCDEYVNNTFDLIANENEVDNTEINILDNGRTKLLLAQCYSVRIESKFEDDFDNFYKNFVDYILLKNLDIPTKPDIMYYMKYLKYKKKYLQLKNIKI